MTRTANSRSRREIVGIRERLARAVAAATIATPLLLSASVGPVNAVYFDMCQLTGYQTNQAIIARPESAQDISGALADVDMRTMSPCTQNGTYADQAGIPISIQYSGTDPNRLVQLGYTQCGDSSGCGYDIPKDGKNHFWYTKHDDGGGFAYLADGWYRAPVVGHRYRMKVEATTHNGASVWQYCIRDSSLGQAYTCHFEPRSWTYGVVAWWGTENHNIHSQNGTRAPDPDINLVAQFKKSGAWFFRDGADNTCHKSSNFPVYYGCVVTSDTRTFWSYTFDH